MVVKQPAETPAYWQMFSKMQILSKDNNRLGNLAKGTLGTLSESIKSSYKGISEDKTLPPAQKALFFNVAHLATPGDPRVPCISAFFYAQAKDKAHAPTCLLREVRQTVQLLRS